MPDDGRYVALAATAALAGAAAGILAFKVMSTTSLATKRNSTTPREESDGRRQSEITADSKILQTDCQRSKESGVVARWTKPVVIASPALEELAESLRKKLGCPTFNDSEGSTIYLDKFKSGDPNLKFNWQRVVGRRILFLFDTVDQSRLFEQLALLQALQGFAVPDGEDGMTKWKTYVNQGKYAWGRAAKITVVVPWFRHCQMERTSRWHIQDGQWTNANPDGEWLDSPTGQYMARLFATPGSVPPLPGPTTSLDGMPLNPLWRPPLEILFLELHEEVPISHSVSDLGATIRMERFVPYFLEKFKGKRNYPGKADMYILFPDRGAYDRYAASVTKTLKLDDKHILFIEKTRVGDCITQQQKLYYEKCNGGDRGQKHSFQTTDHVLIIDDFTNSGSTLFGAVNLVQKMTEPGGTPHVCIYVTHLVAVYDPKVVDGIKGKLRELGPEVRFFTTNTIPITTNLLKGDPQIEVIDVANYIADIVA
jgi:hypothetical protein|eukprot:TRINITY_DN61925_c0_g1_i1.p1 TRINITY_DN61925_c0_g1~~TRINITY_DN61925_c0_g1_i1.p1  ORF type:complete len:523 (-),score=84.62 TRINITY_DN61925_c0_g1_i1:73-1518(-)